jgi:hypothetical protein
MLLLLLLLLLVCRRHRWWHDHCMHPPTAWVWRGVTRTDAALQAIKDHFHFHFIPADGPPDDVRSVT